MREEIPHKRAHTAHTVTSHMDISLFTSFLQGFFENPFCSLVSSSLSSWSSSSLHFLTLLYLTLLFFRNFFFFFLTKIPFAYSSFLQWSRSIEFQRLTLKTACIDATHYISFIPVEEGCLRYLVSSLAINTALLLVVLIGAQHLISSRNFYKRVLEQGSKKKKIKKNTKTGPRYFS